MTRLLELFASAETYTILQFHTPGPPSRCRAALLTDPTQGVRVRSPYTLLLSFQPALPLRGRTHSQDLPLVFSQESQQNAAEALPQSVLCGRAPFYSFSAHLRSKAPFRAYHMFLYRFLNPHPGTSQTLSVHGTGLARFQSADFLPCAFRLFPPSVYRCTGIPGVPQGIMGVFYADRTSASSAVPLQNPCPPHRAEKPPGTDPPYPAARNLSVPQQQQCPRKKSTFLQPDLSAQDISLCRAQKSVLLPEQYFCPSPRLPDCVPHQCYRSADMDVRINVLGARMVLISQSVFPHGLQNTPQDISL